MSEARPLEEIIEAVNNEDVMTSEELKIFWEAVEKTLDKSLEDIWITSTEDELEYRHKLLVRFLSEVVPFEIVDALEEIGDKIIDIYSWENWAVSVLQLLAEQHWYELVKKK